MTDSSFHIMGSDGSGLALLGFCEPAATEFFCGDAGHVGLDVEDRRAVEHIHAAHSEPVAFAREQFHHSQCNWIGTARGACGKDAVRALIEGRASNEIEAVGAIEGPDYEEVGKALDVSEAGLEFGKDVEDAFRVMLGAQAFGDGLGAGIRASDVTDRFRRKHCNALRWGRWVGGHYLMVAQGGFSASAPRGEERGVDGAAE